MCVCIYINIYMLVYIYTYMNTPICMYGCIYLHRCMHTAAPPRFRAPPLVVGG